MSDLIGKNVLITGAGRNIGRAIALEMAAAGANVYFTDIDRHSCDNLERVLSGYSIRSGGFIADITDAKATDKVCDWLRHEAIDIDILINNVGRMTDMLIEQRTISHRITNRMRFRSKVMRDVNTWKEVFDTNLFGPIYLTELITERMIEGAVSGSIIFISSVHESSVSLDAPYSASKAALGMLIKELALSLAPHQIRVNGIAPGYALEDEDGNAESEPHYTPLYGTSINPCYIGRAAVYLSSEYYSKFTTGTILKIDAGLSLYNHIVEANTSREG